MNVQYKKFKCIDIKDWIFNGKSNGLSETIISLTRANALVHCPYVNDDDVLVIVATDEETIVGYTAIFPERLVRPDLWIATGTTLWVDPMYADEFVGYNLVQQLWQSYPQCSVIGSDVTRPAALIDKLLGASVKKYERYTFVLNRKITIRSVRNFTSSLLEPIRKYRQQKNICRVINSISPSVRVVARDVIDSITYGFICKHSGTNELLRSQEMLNWMMRYPFVVENLLSQRSKRNNEFSDQIHDFKNHLLQIYQDKNLIGVVLLGVRNCDLHVKMLYTDNVHHEIVYSIIVEAIQKNRYEKLVSIYPDLNKYLLSSKIALRENKHYFLFTYPKELTSLEPIDLQGIDGDMFA